MMATRDTHRYKIVSVGCGPQDYFLNPNTGEFNSFFWVSEHILELQTVPRFLTALLHGLLAAVPSKGMASDHFTRTYPYAISLFTRVFPK